jgi:uncharacterized protein YndB with AHSA1/START domain
MSFTTSRARGRIAPALRPFALTWMYGRGMGGTSEGFLLELERKVGADRAVVFQAFVDPDQLARWFGPEGFTVAHVEFSARVGARYRLEMRPPQGGHFHVSGKVLEVDPPRRLAFTFVYEEPNPDDVETQVVVSFLDHGDWTEIELSQGRFKTKARQALHRDGWSDSLDKLERLIAAQS